MHALRKACPEELAQAYVEEEYDREKQVVVNLEEKKEEETVNWKDKMTDCKTLEELANVWANMPGSMKNEQVVVDYKEELKAKLTPVAAQVLDGTLIINE